MKIDSIKTPGINNPGRPPAKAESTPSAPSAPLGSTAASSATGDVRLSSTSASLSAQEPTVNMVRVQEIRRAISEGRFEINAGAIADRLITSARELVGNRRQA